MPSYRVGGGVEGAASTVLDIVQRRQAAAVEQEKQQREWNQKMREIVAQNPQDYDPKYAAALIGGQPTTGLSPFRAALDTSTLKPGQTYSQKVGGGTLSTQGGYAFPQDMPTLSKTSTDQERQDFLSRISPEDQDIVQGLADYTLDPAKTSSLFRGNQRQRLLALAKRYNPDFDMKAFTSAQQYVNPNTFVGKNVTSLNTVASHLGYLKEAIDNVHANGQPIQNALVLAARNITGDPSITDFDVAKGVVNSEVIRALEGTVTQEAIRAQSNILKSRFFGERQAQQYVQGLQHLVSARLRVLESGYRQQIKRDPGDLIIYPETRRALGLQEAVAQQTGLNQGSGQASAVPNVTPQQRQIYNAAKARGLTKEQARQQAGF